MEDYRSGSLPRRQYGKGPVSRNEGAEGSHVANEVAHGFLKPAKRVVGRSQTRPCKRNEASSVMQCAATTGSEEPYVAAASRGIRPRSATKQTFILGADSMFRSLAPHLCANLRL